LMYKLSYYRFGDVRIGGHTGFDRTRNTVIGNKNIELTYLEEAYTSEHWLVRIYRVKKPWEFNRPRIARSARKIKTKAALTKKTSKKKKGTLKHRPIIVKGKASRTGDSRA